MEMGSCGFARTARRRQKRKGLRALVVIPVVAVVRSEPLNPYSSGEEREITMAKAVKKLKMASESEANKIFVALGVTSYDAAIELLQLAKQRDEEVVQVQEKLLGAPLDCVLALYKATERIFGVAIVRALTVQGMFGPVQTSAREVVVDVGPNTKVTIPLGDITLPNGYGVITHAPVIHEGREALAVSVKTQRKWRDRIMSVVEEARKVLREESIYRGRAVRMQFHKGEMFPEEFASLSFMDLSAVNPGDLVFASELEGAIRVNLFAPIRYPEGAKAMGVPAKRTVLLAGPYGCGKTMLANVAAKLATEQGRTFIYLEDVLQLPKALKFGEQYGPALIFAEDFDRAAGAANGAAEAALRNTLDGIDTKNLDVLLVLTTNHTHKIPEALKRPGRIDVALRIGPPNAEAAERMLRNYARGRIPESEQLGGVAHKLDGQIPAVIREVIERAKLAALDRTQGVPTDTLLASDVEMAAFTVLEQRELLSEKVEEQRTEHERACELLGAALGEGVGSAVREVAHALSGQAAQQAIDGGNGKLLPAGAQAVAP